MHRLTRLLLLAAATPVVAAAQTVFTGFTANPGCASSTLNTCAQKFAPSGDALAARNSFFSSLSAGVSTNSFESLPTGQSAPVVLNFGFAGNATLTGTGRAEADGPGTTSVGRFATTGTQYWTGSAAGTVGFGISFSQFVAGFGFYGMDLGDIGGTVAVRLFADNTLLTTLDVQPAAGPAGVFIPALNGGMRYWGVLFGSNAFNRVEFTLTGLASNEDVFAFDDLTVADVSQVTNPPGVVPEPSTYALLATGLVGLAAIRRRRAAR